MNPPSSNPPTPLRELTPELRESVKKRAEHNLAALVKKLSVSVFYHESAPLKSLREILGARGIGTPLDVDKSIILQHFYSSVPFTGYDDYYLYVSRLFKKDPQMTDISNLLAPGLPSFVAHSSGTSGAGAKYFFKYPNSLYKPVDWESAEAGVRMGKIKICNFTCLTLRELVRVAGDGNEAVHIPVSLVSAGGYRTFMGISPTDDAYLIDKKASFVTSPFAVWLLPVYTANVYMNAFFGILDGSVAFMVTTFSTILYDAVRLIEEHWESWIEAIESGQLPGVEGLGEYRVHLQAHLKPNHSRAAELRLIKKGEQGWLKQVWPNLAIVRVTLSGPYSMPLPKLRHHFGPSVNLQSVVYASTETVVGHGYDAHDTNLYRLDSDEHIELLDTEKECAIENLCQPWEVEQGKRYEIVATNKDGLWRYMLNDVVEIAGFSPVDGQPLIRYIGRKDVAFRVHSEFVSQSFLQQAITSLSGSLGDISEFTVELDERKPLRAYGFIVELQDELGPNACLALEQLKQAMLCNAGYKKFFDIGFIGNPTIRIVSHGTFNAYRSWYVGKSGFNPAQVKVPCAIVDPEVRQFLADRVTIDLELKGLGLDVD